MQATLTTFTRDGRAWQTSYLLEINPALCIGCGRCFKVCGQRVKELKGIDEDGNEVIRLPNDKEPLALLAFKIMDDPFVGTITFCRIYSGTLLSGTGVIN